MENFYEEVPVVLWMGGRTGPPVPDEDGSLACMGGRLLKTAGRPLGPRGNGAKCRRLSTGTAGKAAGDPHPSGRKNRAKSPVFRVRPAWVRRYRVKVPNGGWRAPTVS